MIQSERADAIVVTKQMARTTTKTLLPHEKAARAGRWAEIMCRALASRVGKRWRIVSFRGKGAGEWVGIVDLVAIRKSSSVESPFRRGDLFDIVFIQTKGGNAAEPTDGDKIRLNAVKQRYGARAVVLFSWKRGESAVFRTLRRYNRMLWIG